MTRAIRFVHAADLHLDAPFKGVDAADPRVRQALVASTYDALESLVEVCLTAEADFLVVAGDVYNAGEPSLRAQFAFRDACTKLIEAGVRVYIARGNHDATSLGTRLALAEGVHEFSASAVERVVYEAADGASCAIYGRSFRASAERANLAQGYKRQIADTLAIGVLHTNVGGRPGHEPYAPCSLEDLRASGMDYWALGHIHKPEVLGSEPEIVYAGCTQGLTPNECGVRGCRVVTLGPDGAHSRFLPTSAVIWDQATVDVTGMDDADGLLAALAGTTSRMSAGAEGRPTVLRIMLEGRSRLHAELARPGALADIRAEAASSALERSPWVWIDRVVDRTRPMLDLDSLRDGQDLPGDLVRMTDALEADGAALAGLLESVASPLLARIDSHDTPTLDAASILERARDLALDRLLAGEER